MLGCNWRYGHTESVYKGSLLFVSAMLYALKLKNYSKGSRNESPFTVAIPIYTLHPSLYIASHILHLFLVPSRLSQLHGTPMCVAPFVKFSPYGGIGHETCRSDFLPGGLSAPLPMKLTIGGSAKDASPPPLLNADGWEILSPTGRLAAWPLVSQDVDLPFRDWLSWLSLPELLLSEPCWDWVLLFANRLIPLGKADWPFLKPPLDKALGAVVCSFCDRAALHEQTDSVRLWQPKLSYSFPPWCITVFNFPRTQLQQASGFWALHLVSTRLWRCAALCEMLLFLQIKSHSFSTLGDRLGFCPCTAYWCNKQFPCDEQYMNPTYWLRLSMWGHCCLHRNAEGQNHGLM